MGALLRERRCWQVARFRDDLGKMNRFHRWYCQTSHWRHTLEKTVMPWALAGVELDHDVLEVGPGPGLTTDWLRLRAKRVTCIEMDLELAGSLQSRVANTNVDVRCGDATAMPFADRTFMSVVCCTVLHHVPSRELQDRLFAEAFRVLKPGGSFAGTDSLGSLLMRIIHLGDTMVLVDPATLPSRLESAGFRNVGVEVGTGRFRFLARRPIGSHNRDNPSLRKSSADQLCLGPHTRG